MPRLRAPRRLLTGVIVSSTAVATMALGTGTAGAVTLAPKLSWSPTTTSNTFDYGNVTVGTTSTQTFTLRNSGLLPTGRLNASLTGSSAFAITADSCTGKNLAYKKTCTVTVRYTPDATGESVATLSARSVFGASASLTLRGTGVNPVVFHFSGFQPAPSFECSFDWSVSGLSPSTTYTSAIGQNPAYPFVTNPAGEHSELDDVADPGVPIRIQIFDSNGQLVATSQTITPTC